jgi:hypothetical protein
MTAILNIHRGDAETRRFDEVTSANLKLCNLPLGLLINFHVPALKSGLKRIVNSFSESSASPRLRGSINLGGSING